MNWLAVGRTSMSSVAQVVPITEGFGADIVGMDLSAPLDSARQAWLTSMLDTHHLLRFRGQNVAPEVQVSVLSSFGSIVPNDDGREYYYVSNIETVSSKVDALGSNGSLLWHSDYMWFESTLQVLSLYAERVEPPVAPTLFSCAATAVNRLSPDLIGRIRGLSAEHTSNGWTARDSAKDSSTLETVWPGQQPLVRPLISKNPRTQAEYLCVSQQHTRRIVDMSDDAGEALLSELFEQLYDPRYVIVHEWANDDLVVWDNIALQHARPDFTAESKVRHLRKVNAGGAIPVRQLEFASKGQRA
jgi:taurine dioxygenase